MEEWREIPGFDGQYAISSLGRLKNAKRDRLMKWCRGTHGYHVARLRQNGRYKVGSSRVDLQACKLEYSIVSPK